MRLLHGPGGIAATFDDHNVVSRAGLVPVMRLAQVAGLWGLVAAKLRVPTDKGANAAGKVATIVAAMAAGANFIAHMDVVRDAGLRRLFGGVYAPSTLGEFLRAFTHGHVRQLPGVSRGVSTPLQRGAGADPHLGRTESQGPIR